MNRVNAVVAGAGAAGGVVAKELSTAGLSVVLLERGKWYTANDCRKDDLRNQAVSVLGCAFGPEDEGHPRVWVDEHGAPHTVVPSESQYQNDAACVGGGTLSWGAQAWRFMPQDFKMRSTYGAPPGSSLEDWPISYDDLEPFYEKAEYEIGVSGDYSDDPFHGPRRRGLPMPPLPPNREFEILLPAAKRLGLHPLNIPMARNSVPYNGRGPCMRCRWCSGFVCETDAKNGTHNTVIPVALSTGNCELRTDCTVKEVLIDDRGRARGVAYFDAKGRLQEQLSDIVVVSGGATESARLLLNSKSRLFPNGLGNRYDQVGRNLQGHHYAGATGYFDFETYDDVGPGASIAICDYNHGTPGLCGGGMLDNEFIRLPIQMVDRLPAPRDGDWDTSRECATGTSALSGFMGRCSRFLRPTPGSRLIPSCVTSGECRCCASRAMCTLTRLKSATRKPRALKPGSKRREPFTQLCRPRGPRSSPPINTRRAPAAWATIRKARSSIAPASFTTWTTSL